MKITKEISVILSKYDESSIIEIIYFNGKALDKVCPFLSYSIKSDDFFSLAKMEYNNFTYSVELNVEKNSSFYFSLIDNGNDEKYHIYLGNSSEECVLIDNSVSEKNENIFNNQADNLPILINTSETKLVKRKKRLPFTYKLNKRIKIFLIKIYRLMPKFITGNYRRRINL
jgi:hypothetical protein